MQQKLALFHTILNYSQLPQPDTKNTISNVLNIVFGITGSISVLMVVIGGFRYIIASHGGESKAAAQARMTVIYAVVGLVVTMAAYSIVIFAVKEVG